MSKSRSLHPRRPNEAARLITYLFVGFLADVSTEEHAVSHGCLQLSIVPVEARGAGRPIQDPLLEGDQALLSPTHLVSLKSGS